MPKPYSKKPQASSVRIIAGEWRGRRLKVIDAPGLRPTTDRIRETLFNWLMSDLAGARCLDLFAGTGALGFESLSRGASYVHFCEVERKAISVLGQNIETLELTKDRVGLSSTPALKLVKQWRHEPFDIIFLDPPFGQEGLLEATLAEIKSSGILNDSGLVYVERDKFDDALDFESLGLTQGNDEASSQTRFKKYRTQTSGNVSFELYSLHTTLLEDE